MSLTNKTISSSFIDVISIDNSNAGFDTNIDQIRSGNGNGSALYLSTNNLKVQPSADSTTNSVIYDKDGNTLFQVDSTNDAVKALGNHVNTQYAHFGITNNGAGKIEISSNLDHSEYLHDGTSNMESRKFIDFPKEVLTVSSSIRKRLIKKLDQDKTTLYELYMSGKK